MIHAHLWSQATGALTEVPPEALAQHVGQPGTAIWLDLASPTDDELALLGSQFGVMHLTVEDIAKQGQRAKLESFSSYLFLVMHGISFHDEKLATPEVDFVLGRDFVLSVHDGTLAAVAEDPHLGGRLAELLSQGADLLLYALTDRLVDSYFPAIEALDDAIDALEDEIVAQPTEAVLTRIFKLKREVARLRRMLAPQLEIFSQLTARETGFVHPDHAVYFRDVHDHLIRIFELVDSYRDLMSGALDAYLSTVSNRMNEVMKRLAVVASLFLPVSFLTGVFGMNFGNQPWVQGDPGFLAWIALAVMAVLFVLQLLYFRAKRWI